jgi:PAB-dependent poly(A)-specific ribonuclease subunit 2
MPFYRDQLLSAWPSHVIQEVRRPPSKIDSQVLASMKPQEFGGYAPNPRKHRRNQLHDNRNILNTNIPLVAPKFLSEKAREASSTGSNRSSQKETTLEEPTSKVETSEIPLIYRKVEIRYSRFGVDDFDFE